MSGEPMLQVALSAHFKGKTVLHDMRFELRRGEVLGLVGTSGAGKSTLVLALLGLLPWRGGRVSGHARFSGQNLLELDEAGLRRVRGRRIALIPQSPMSALNAALTLGAHFIEAWRAHERSGRDALMARLLPLLAEVHLPEDADFLARRPNQISVGQAQRVLIALGVLHRPEILIADEPTSALDPVTQRQVVSLLGALNRRHGTSLLYISHDLVSVLQLCDRVAVLDGGSIVETLALRDLGRAQHPATRALIDALPVPLDVLLANRFAATE